MTGLISACIVDTAPSEIGPDNTQWVHVLPAGRTFGRDGRGPYALTEPARVLADTQRFHGRNKMVVDYEHQSVHAAKNGRPNPAAGWIVGLEARENGIWAKTEWTEQAAQMIRDKLYRYVSPVFNHDSTGTIKRILNVALTNTPNLDMTALAYVEIGMKTEIGELRTLLGLPAEADFEAIRAAIVALQTSANSTAAVDPAKYVPIGDFERVVADANQLRQGVTESVAINRVEEDVRSGKLAPFLKEWAVSLCKVNVPAYDSFMNRVGPAFAEITSAFSAGFNPPPAAKAGTLSEDELAVASRMGLTAEEYTKAR